MQRNSLPMTNIMELSPHALDFEKQAGQRDEQCLRLCNVVYTCIRWRQIHRDRCAHRHRLSRGDRDIYMAVTVANSGCSARRSADVTRGDVFGAAVDGKTLTATITADDAAFTATKLVNMSSTRRTAQQATPAGWPVQLCDANSDVVWTLQRQPVLEMSAPTV